MRKKRSHPMSKYILTVGDTFRSKKLRDCRSDQWAQAKAEAEEVLAELHTQGQLHPIVRVVEEEQGGGGKVVYACGRQASDRGESERDEPLTEASLRDEGLT